MTRPATTTPAPDPAAVEAMVKRLANPLPVCPFDRRSPDYWTTGNNGEACHVCGGTEEVDRCKGADTRVMDEAAAMLTALSARVVELEGAMEPFGDAAKHYRHHQDEYPVVLPRSPFSGRDDWEPVIPVKAFRRARTLSAASALKGGRGE